MSDELFSFPAETREGSGTGKARALRRLGMIPGVIYGADDGPVKIAVEQRLLKWMLDQGGFFGKLVNVEVKGSKAVRVLPKDLQLHPVTDLPMHVDFIRVIAGATITVTIPITFLNDEESPGKKAGGVMNIVRAELEVVCAAESIPDSIELDLANAEIGDTFNLDAIRLPAGVTPTSEDPELTIVTIMAPRVELEPEESELAEGEEGEAAEGEEGESEEGEAGDDGDEDKE